MTYREFCDHCTSVSQQHFLRSFDGVVPPHFYGEMAKTELGCQTLHEKGHFPEFALFIRQHGHEKEDPELILKLKSILWTVVSCAIQGKFSHIYSCIGKYRFFCQWSSIPRRGRYL